MSDKLHSKPLVALLIAVTLFPTIAWTDWGDFWRFQHHTPLWLQKKRSPSRIQKKRDAVPMATMVKTLPMAEPEKLEVRGLALGLGDEMVVGPVGGPGGNDFEIHCGDSSVVAAYLFKAGDWIDSLHKLGCKDLNSLDKNEISWIVPVFAGGDGGMGYFFEAPSGYAMTGASAKTCNPGACIVQTEILDEFLPVAMRVDPLEGIVKENIWNNDNHSIGRGANANPSSDWQHLQCPDGYLQTGVKGRAGKYLDQLSLVCRRFIVKLMAR